MWAQWITLGRAIRDLPRETRLCLSLLEYQQPSRVARIPDAASLPRDALRPLTWVHLNLFTYTGLLQQGTLELGMWAGAANPLGSALPNQDRAATSIVLEFIASPLPICWLSPAGATLRPPSFTTTPFSPPKEVTDEIQAVLHSDLLAVLSPAHVEMISRFPYWCMTTHPLCISKYLRCITWHDRQSVEVAHQLIRSWPSIDPAFALELLGSQFQDSSVRNFAVSCLCSLSDNDLSTVLLQLVQAVKHEQYHSSSLANYLILSAARSSFIAHQMYWYAEAEIRDPTFFFRFKLLKKSILESLSAQHRQKLLLQTGLVRGLVTVATEIKGISDKSLRQPALQRALSAAKIRGDCGLPIDSCVDTSALEYEHCKVMQSFTVPLWLKFQNADPIGRPVYAIFKIGDDLRQDILTIQLLDVMDKIWKDNGLNLHLIPYKCVATGPSQGFIEIVGDAKTLADIHKSEGGGALGALKEKVLSNWLQQENPTPAAFEAAVRLFTHSLAGYSVATYILGIGDRHSDNLMITRRGNLFHIDFAHFLGNTLKFAGIDRETTPFVLTPDFVYVIGGDRKERSDNFKYFTNLACQAYHLVRLNGNRFITLLEMMLSTGIPQLTKVQDIYYLRESLKLGASREVADSHFRRQIERSLHNKRSVWMNFFHTVANPD